MKAAQKLVLCLLVLSALVTIASAQTSPNLENGWKPFGSYDGTHLDTVNLMNGNLMLHLPLVPDVPQRGAVPLGDVLFTTSKDWQVVCATLPSGHMGCSWKHGATQFQVQPTVGVSVQRTINTVYVNGTLEAQSAFAYVLVTNDGATHQLQGVAGTADAYGVPTKYDTFDLTGYHLEMSNPDTNGVPGTFTVIDRHGVQYQSDLFHQPYCGRFPQANNLPQIGNYASMTDDSSNGGQSCQQFAYATLVTDSNGNQMNLTPYQASSGMRDTLGRIGQMFLSGPAFNGLDSTGCVSSHPFASSVVLYYVDPNGVTQPVKECFSNLSLLTAFNQTSPYGGLVSEYSSGVSGAIQLLTTVVLADGTKWTFDYDSYGKLTFVGLPTGGSITYTWQAINFANCDLANPTQLSRAVTTRTLNDGQGHIQTWNYNWGTTTSSGLTNVVTDPLGNDTVHIFTQQAPAGGNPPPGCFLYETSTIDYQGSQGAGHPLQRVDTTYSSGAFASSSGAPAVGNVFATDIVTTVYPSGKVKKVHRDPDAGPGAGQPIFGNIKRELEYDWGQGAPGALLRETDTTYQWEINSAYLTAHLLDLPTSAVVKDGVGNRVAETDYTYDEASYLTAASISTQHVAPPYGVRGNQSTVSRWLSTNNSFISSHTNWYDTGEVYKQIDPLGHTTIHSYDPAYVGAYATQTCSPTTSPGSVVHCVSGTYDFNTGVLTSLTNENASTQASGTTPGDSAHTSNYGYDYMFRLTSAQAPPDLANGNLRAQNTFSFSAPNTFPVSVQRTTSVTTSLSDSATNYFDGLARNYKGQHILPNGTATVDTTFDAGGHVATVSNPYFTTSDPTYGITANQYDGMDRVTQTTKQDGSISKVQYNVATTIAVNGDCTISADEAGKQRGACTDALGRLVEVDEPAPSGATPVANYHATLDNTGNFLLANSGNTSLWSTGTSGTNASSIFMQDDGNLVLYIFKWSAGTYAAPTPGSYPQAACSIGTYLVAGQTLPSGSCIASPHWQYFLYMAPDGNLYIYNWATGAGTWGPGTQGHPGAYATLQTDGNFVVYSSTGVALWSSGTSGTNAERLDMEDDGRIILYKSAWNSGTSTGQFNWSQLTHPACDAGIGTGTTGMLGSGQCFVSPNGHFELLMQTDGNLVINDLGATPPNMLWSTSTGISPADPGYALRTLYTYDTLGNLTCVEQHGDAATGTGCSSSPTNDATSPWRVRRFTYDSLGRLLSAKNPESGTISYLYDNDGSLLQKTSPAPNQTGSATQTISYCYDELHRVTGKAYGALSCPLTSTVVSYAYDSGANAKGHLTQMTDQAGTATYSYDVLGRLATETRTLAGANNATISNSVSYEYNLDSSLYKLHYPSGAVVTYKPWNNGSIAVSIPQEAEDQGSGINYVTGGGYGPDLSLTGFISGSGGTAPVTNLFSYNNRLQPCRMTASTGTLPSNCLDTTNHGNVFDISYDFHKGNGTAGSGADNGNVFGITNYKDSNRTQTFTYDPLNRLLSAQNAGTNCAAMTVNNKTEYWGNSYTYDAWGNLLGKTITKCGAEHLSVTADAHNWLHISPNDYQYDAAGNMTYDATSSLNYSFDQENRITGAANYTYTYDGDGNRVRKSYGNLAGNGTLYWYMTPGVVAESDLAGTLKSEYVLFNGERVARKDFTGSTTSVAYYFSDHLKTASVITDAAGTIKADSDYYPWGGELQFVNNDSNHVAVLVERLRVGQIGVWHWDRRG
jgi:YD repeat-containing protein